MRDVRNWSRAALAAVAACVATGAAAQQVGDWVLSPWRGSRVLYPGVIEARSGTSVTVRFDDGSVETRQANTIRFFDWEAGSRVACMWSDGNYYNAVILSIADDGYSMKIRYDEDGSTESTNTGKCRTR